MARRVLSLISTLARTGPVHALKGIAGNYDSRRYLPIVATLSPEGPASLFDDFRCRGIVVEQLNLSRMGSLVSGLNRVRAVVESTGADLVHCHGIRADVLATQAGLRCPVVATLHSDLGVDYRMNYGVLLGALMARYDYAALKKMSAVIAVSSSVSQAAGRHGLATEVIPNGVDLNTYNPRLRHGLESIRARIGWPSGVPVVLHTGVLIPRKRPQETIDAFRCSALSTRGFLVFAGDGPLMAECRKLAAGAKNIQFLGHRADIPELLCAADLLVSNSLSEGLPYSLLEACACGIRLLVSDIPPHRQIQELFPQQVEVFPVNDKDTLAHSFNRLTWGDSLGIPPAASLEAISAERMSLSYQNLYDRILETSRTESGVKPESRKTESALSGV